MLLGRIDLSQRAYNCQRDILASYPSTLQKVMDNEKGLDVGEFLPFMMPEIAAFVKASLPTFTTHSKNVVTLPCCSRCSPILPCGDIYGQPRWEHIMICSCMRFTMFSQEYKLIFITGELPTTDIHCERQKRKTLT